MNDAELCQRRGPGNLNRTEWTSVRGETKDKPKGHRVKEKEGRGGGWNIVRGFKILSYKILLI